jgi:hypothetical protein
VIQDTQLTILKSRGVKGLIAFNKAVRLNLLNYLSGNPERVLGCQLALEGIPKILGPFVIQLVRKEVPREILQLLLTMLFFTRGLELPARPNIKTITEPLYEGSKIDIDIHMAEFWRSLGFNQSGRLPRSLLFSRFHFTNKVGPFGHALYQWQEDLRNLPNRLLESIQSMGGEGIKEFIKSSSVQFPDLFGKEADSSNNIFVRKLSYFSDKEGKTRIIGILDYFSQTVLKKLHQYLFRILSRIPQDCTFEQSAFLKGVANWPIYYSVDLSAATDRFPIQVIYDLLRTHLPEEYCQAWLDIMVGYPFRYKSPAGDIQGISYAVGNPMGAYSSWASFALAHHYLIFFICQELGRDWKSCPYYLLGDDIIIGDAQVGEAYLKLIKSLGIDYAPEKTHISKTLFEFTKRWFYNGQEISPFPLSGLICKRKIGPCDLLQLLLDSVRKDWIFQYDLGDLIFKYYSMVDKLPSRFCRSLRNLSLIMEVVMEITRGTLPAKEGLSTLDGWFGISHFSNMHSQEAHSFLATIIREAFHMTPSVTEHLIAANRDHSLDRSKVSTKDLWLFLDNDPVMQPDGSMVMSPIIPNETLVEDPVIFNLREATDRIWAELSVLDSADVGNSAWDLAIRAMSVPIPSTEAVSPEKRESRIISTLARKVRSYINTKERSWDFITLLGVSNSFLLWSNSPLNRWKCCPSRS